jgi:hypothetical protein
VRRGGEVPRAGRDGEAQPAGSDGRVGGWFAAPLRTARTRADPAPASVISTTGSVEVERPDGSCLRAVIKHGAA